MRGGGHCELREHYNAKGFDFRHVDATSDVDLGDRFDRVFIGDVIEHVNDPVALLNFAKRHLQPNGRILVRRQIRSRRASASTAVSATRNT